MLNVLKYCIIRKMSTHNIKTFIFLDLETTGIPWYENNTTKITELCLTAVQSDHIRLGVFPRVQNKLNLCFNPWKLISEDAEKITGLSNNILENSPRFSKETVSAINHFLNHNPQPVCFVAHNGFNFDFPILRREINKSNAFIPNTVLCIDTLISFRQLECEQEDELRKINQGVIHENMNILKATEDVLEKDMKLLHNNAASNDMEDTVDGICINMPIDCDTFLFSRQAQAINETTPKRENIRNSGVPPNPKKLKVVKARKSLNFRRSYKLGDVFSRLTKKEPVNAHQADADVQMLVICAATLGDKFVDWCNKNAKLFCDIPPMVPGKKIGT